MMRCNKCNLPMDSKVYPCPEGGLCVYTAGTLEPEFMRLLPPIKPLPYPAAFARLQFGLWCWEVGRLGNWLLNLRRIFSRKYWKRCKALKTLSHARFYVNQDTDAMRLLVEKMFEVIG